MFDSCSAPRFSYFVLATSFLFVGRGRSVGRSVAVGVCCSRSVGLQLSPYFFSNSLLLGDNPLLFTPPSPLSPCTISSWFIQTTGIETMDLEFNRAFTLLNGQSIPFRRLAFIPLVEKKCPVSSGAGSASWAIFHTDRALCQSLLRCFSAPLPFDHDVEKKKHSLRKEKIKIDRP